MHEGSEPRCSYTKACSVNVGSIHSVAAVRYIDFEPDSEGYPNKTVKFQRTRNYSVVKAFAGSTVQE